MDFNFLRDTFLELLSGVPLTLQLATISLVIGFVLATVLALFRYSEILLLDWCARFYFFVFRGTPLLVQLFLIYYGLGQFETVRESSAWTILREPYWCAIGALILNTAAYSGNILYGGLIAVPYGQVEAALACGMSKFMIFRRIMMPLAIRQALPGYSNEMISMVKATSLASIITLSEITGIASRLISESYRPVEVLIAAGAIYLAINFVLTRLIQLYENYLNPRSPREEVVA